MASSSRLKPGEKGQISATLNLEGRKGIVRKNVRVYTNDPKRATVTLTLSAAIE